ncbi:MAG: hypothetical protein JXQ96_14820 [Cyclobacteriaceae bacterium]
MPFKKGHKGHRKGAKGKKTEQWEAIGEAISGRHAENFNDFMDELWEGDFTKKSEAAELYLKTLEYFKPKQARVESIHSGDVSVSSLVFEDAKKDTD